MLDVSALDFGKGGGLITVVARDDCSGAVLMVAFADREAIEKTIASGEMHYHSRSRGPWHKGGTSGNVQRVVSLHADCDGDVVLASVVPAGPSCHTGQQSCFGAAGVEPGAVARLATTIGERVTTVAGDPGYTRRLLLDRNLRLKKLGEEAAELAVACADGDRTRAVNEAADLMYHSLVALAALGISWSDVQACLNERARGPRPEQPA
jgi:phosphoribosyl-ATP pyrophosphohydrolase/phosphoribosyl-AMP cyclohydrolase